MISPSIQQEIIKRICLVSTPEKIYIFGSFAYGLPDKKSDLDIAVICKNVFAKSRESVIIRKALKGIFGSIDVVVTTPQEFEYYSHEPGSIYKTIAEKGIVIYA